MNKGKGERERCRKRQRPRVKTDTDREGKRKREREFLERRREWLSGKEYACNAGDEGLIIGLGSYPGGRHGNLLQYSCMGNRMDRGAWQATVHQIAKSQT